MAPSDTINVRLLKAVALSETVNVPPPKKRKTFHSASAIDKKLDALECLHTRLRSTWLKSSLRQHVLSSLRDGLVPWAEIDERGEFDADNAVCMGLRTFTGKWAEWRAASMLLLIFFLDVVDFLEKTNYCPVTTKLYAQDPQFEELDYIFLKSFAIEIVECPRANDCITSRSFLFTPWMLWRPTVTSPLPGQHPLLYIGHDMYKLAEEDYTKHMDRGMDEELTGRAAKSISKKAEAMKPIVKGFLNGK